MKRALGWIIALVTVVVLAGGAVAGAELILRNTVPDRIAAEVRGYLNLSDDHPVDVHVDGFVAPQFVGGAFKNVRIEVPDAPITDGIRGDLYGTTTSLPVRAADAPLGETIVGVRFDEEQLGAVLQLLSRGIGQQLVIDGEMLAIENSFTVFGQRIPLSVTFAPSVREGLIHVDPRSVDAGPLTLTVDQLRSVPGLGDLVLGFDICIADRIPRGVTLDDIHLSTTNTVSVEARIDPELITDPGLQEPGACS